MRKVLLVASLTILFSNTLNAATVADDALVEFQSNTTAKASEVNDNFKALKDAINSTDQEIKDHNHDDAYYSKSEVDSKINQTTTDLQNNINNHNHDTVYYTQTYIDQNFAKLSDQTAGSNYIPNATLEAGMMGWETVSPQSTGDLVLVDTPNGAAAEKALQNPQSAITWGSSTTWITLDRTKTYYVSGVFKQLAGGSVGGVRLVVRLRKSDGTEIESNPGEWWLNFPNVPLVEDKWVQFRAQFGRATKFPFDTQARYMTIGFMLNVDVGNVPGNRTFQVQGLAINDAMDNKCMGDDMVSYGNGCISPLQTPGATFYVAQEACKSKYKGTICMYNEIQRACASGVIATVGPPSVWLGDHGSQDNEHFVTNSDTCKADMDGSAILYNAANLGYRCCR